MIARRVVLIVVVALAATVVQAIQVTTHDGVISGRIFDSTTNAGIPGMTVKLTPPKATGRPQRVTRTDAEGAFDFGKLAKGRYLLEVYQGATLLHRRVIDNTQDQQFEVSLRPKRA
jgi:hypothetical protein